MSEKMSREKYLALTNAKQPTLDGIDRADHSERGKGFEDELAHVHHFYLGHGLVDVVQNPNAWDFAKGKDYFTYKSLYERGDRCAARTGDGRYLMRVVSDVDFSGSSNGYIFDAKETKGKSFPLAKIAGHQVDRLVRSKRCGNCAGAMVKFTELHRVFFIDADYLQNKFTEWNKSKGNNKIAARGTASISLAEFEEFGKEIFRDTRNGNWDWLKVLKKD